MNGQAKTKPVVVGVDGSDDGMRAVAWGVRNALSNDVDLLLAHAVDDAVLAGAWGVVHDPGLLMEAGQEAADRARDHALSLGFPEERLTAKVFMGSPGAVLTRLSEEATILVVGRRSLSGLERLFVGSTSIGVAATAHCPVVMLSAASHRPTTGELGWVGVGIDQTEHGKEALAFGFGEAARRGLNIRVIHAAEAPGAFFADQATRDERLRAQMAKAEDEIRKLLAPLKEQYPHVVTELLVVAGHPVNELTERSKDVDLLVLGLHGINFPGFGPGGTIRAVMAHCYSPLALVRSSRKPRD